MNNPGTLPDYNGQVDPPDAEYPFSKARNDAVPGDLTGTPRVKGEINDFLGFQAAVATVAGLTPSGSPDTALVSQLLEGLQTVMGRTASSLRSVLVTGPVLAADIVISVTAVGANTDLALLGPSDPAARMVEIFRPDTDAEDFNVTLTPVAGTIRGEAFISLLPGEGYRCFPDGTADYILRAS